MSTVAIQRASCLACGQSVADSNVVCRRCAADPFAMEDARGRAALLGGETLATLYSPKYEYLPEGKLDSLWEDNICGEKDTIPEFSAWRNVKSVGLVPSDSRRILEIGIGVGQAIRLMHQRMPEASLYGVDLSKGVVDRISRDVDGSFAVASIEQLPWSGTQFDAIVMLEVLEHIEAPRTFRVLKALRERLTAGGSMIVSVPLWEDLRRSYFPCPHCGQRIHQIGHLRSYSPELLRAELSLAGFTVTKELPLAGGRYFGIRRQYLMPLLPNRIRPMVLVVRCQAL